MTASAGAQAGMEVDGRRRRRTEDDGTQASPGPAPTTPGVAAPWPNRDDEQYLPRFGAAAPTRLELPRNVKSVEHWGDALASHGREHRA